MEPTKIQSAGYNITYIAQPGEHGPRVLWDDRSPFNAAATAAIKASFTGAQWDLIKDWGKNSATAYEIAAINTYAVGDPLIMYSLVSGLGKVRGLAGDCVAYINTGIYPNQDTGFDVSLIPTDSSNSSCGMLSGSRSGNDAGLELYYWSNVWQIISNSPMDTGVSVQVGKRQRIVRYGVDWSVYINDALAASGTRAKAGAFTSNSPICLYVLNRNNAKSYQGKPIYTRAIIKQDGQEDLMDMIPCIHNGENGMLDLVNAQWYGNANSSGAFTIKLGTMVNGVFVAD